MTDQSKKSGFLQKFSKIILGLILFFTLVYSILGFTFDRQFFVRDAQEKYGRVLGATTLSLHIIGPPEKPVLSAEARCNSDKSPFVRLAWNATQDTDDYAIDRDGNPLINGLTETTYDDYAVQSQTTYSYIVTAFGSAGQTASDPIVATTNFCNALPDPTCVITTFDAINLTGFSGIPRTRVSRPTISGATNIENAQIEISLAGPTSIIASTLANANGFWLWQPSADLDSGTYTLTVTAIDPNDLTRQKSAVLDFDILQEKKKKDHNENKRETASIQIPASPTRPSVKTNAPFTLTLAVLNRDSVVYAGQELKTKLTVNFKDPLPKHDRIVDYLIIDPSGKIVYKTASETITLGETAIYKSIALPRLLKNGRYKAVAQMENNGTLISAESFFRLQEPPLIVAGPIRFTLTELTENLGWVIAILLLLLLIFLALLSIEYWLYKHSKIHITEDFLERKGFLGKRREVLR